MKRLILYDLDGTLVDTLEDLTQAVNQMARVLQLPDVSAEEVRRNVGRGVQELVKRCLKTEDPKRVANGVKAFRAYYAQHLVDQSQLYPGAQAVLDYFVSRRQAVITNKPTEFSREILKRLGVARYFLEVVGGDSPYPQKPDPAAVIALMGRLQTAPAETLFVGDSPIDIETGRSARIFTVAVAHELSDERELSSAGPDALVRNFQELLKLIRQRRW